MRLSLAVALACALSPSTVLALAVPNDPVSPGPIAPEALDVTPPTNQHEALSKYAFKDRIFGRGSPRHHAWNTDLTAKYFHESTFHEHYDGRFATQEVMYDQRRVLLVALMQSYLATMNELGAQTWIMHGSLLGWWWNKRILPWDTDIDVMVSEDTMDMLAKTYNMTIHHFAVEGAEQGHDYMLEINPNYVNASTSDELNKIDGRWVDMQSGLFIDMTVMHDNTSAQAAGQADLLMSKDGHHYRRDDVFPLRESTFEGVSCLVPYGYTELLIEEYGTGALTRKDYALHHFDERIMDWLPVTSVVNKPNPEPGYPRDGGGKHRVSSIKVTW